MSKNITLFGQDYSSVPAINVPLQGGGTARFIDEDDAGGGDLSLALQVAYTAPAINGSYTGTSSRGYVTVTIPNYFPFTAYDSLGHRAPFIIKSGTQTITVTGENSAEVTFSERDINEWYENAGPVAYMTEGEDGFDLKIINANTQDSSGQVTVNVSVPSVQFLTAEDLSIFPDW